MSKPSIIWVDVKEYTPEERIAQQHLEVMEAARQFRVAKNKLKDMKKQLKDDQEEAAAERAYKARKAEKSCYGKARRLANKYDITLENDSTTWEDGYDMKYWVSQPEWLLGDDPLEDGHYAYDWATVLWLVEFYAKHHPEHPQYDQRETCEIRPGC
jgi:hypothetical protein